MQKLLPFHVNRIASVLLNFGSRTVLHAKEGHVGYLPTKQLKPCIVVVCVREEAKIILCTCAEHHFSSTQIQLRSYFWCLKGLMRLVEIETA